MLVTNIRDIDEFFKVIDSCEGKVELVSNEGDQINLKSQLTKYISFAKIFSDDKISELEILTENQEDAVKILRYMMKG